jgi:predicted metal-dependent hydrolase
MNTLCHELLHVRIPKMRHGKAFEKMVRKMVRVAEKVK